MSSKCAFFDLDGVLHLSFSFEQIVVPYTLEKLLDAGAPTDMEQGLNIMKGLRAESPDSKTHFDDFCTRIGLSYEASARFVAVGRLAYHEKKYEMIRQNKDAKVLLDYLKENDFKRVIITAGEKITQWEKLILNDLAHYFIRDSNMELIEGSDRKTVDPGLYQKDNLYALEQKGGMTIQQKTEKKHDLFQTAIKDLKVNPEESIVIDDRVYGIVAAKLPKDIQEDDSQGTRCVPGIKYGIFCDLPGGKYAGDGYEPGVSDYLKHDITVDNLRKVPELLVKWGIGK